eukprot:1868787-Pyramimonas_sp.AAC.1
MTTSIFGILPGPDSFGTEKDYAPSLRMAWAGSRMVIATPVTNLNTYMINTAKVETSVLHTSQMANYWKQMSKESLQQYVASGASVYYITVDASTTYYMPAGIAVGNSYYRLSSTLSFPSPPPPASHPPAASISAPAP